MRRSLTTLRTALALVAVLVVVATALTAPSAQAAPGDGRISGRVLDQNGEPAQWYTVSLERYTDTTTQVGSVRTDADGRFSFSALPDGDYGFNSLCEEECVWMGTYATFDEPSITVTNGEAVTRNGRIERPTWVVADVTDSNGGPQTGLQAYAVSTQGTIYCWNFEPEPGAYVSSCERGGTFAVEASANDLSYDGRARATTTVATGHVARVSLTLPDQVAVRGRLLDSSGRPVAGMEVAASTPGTDKCGAATDRTGADGRFVVLCQPTQDLTIAFTDEVKLRFLDRVKKLAVKTADIDLVDATVQRGAVLSATVTDASGKAVRFGPDMTLFQWKNDQWLPADLNGRDDSSSRTARTRLVEPGTYRVQLGQLRVDQPEIYGYPTFGRVFARDGAKVKVTYGSSVALGTVRLPKGARTTTTVPHRTTTASTSTRPTATVKIAGGRGKPTGVLTMTIDGEKSSYRARTNITADQNGRRTVTGPTLPKGTYYVRLSYRGHGAYLDSRSGAYKLTVR